MLSEYRQIVARLRAAKRRALGLAACSSLLAALAAVNVTIVAGAGIEALFRLDVRGRTILIGVLALATALEFGYFALPAILRYAGILRRPSDDDMARAVGEKFPAVHDDLLNGLQLARIATAGAGAYYSGSLIEASFGEIARRVEGLDFSDAIETDGVKRAGKMFFASLALPLLTFGALAPFRDAAYRIAHFNESFLPPPLFSFHVSPGNAECIKGDSVRVTIRTAGIQPQTEITLNTRESDEEFFHPEILHSADGDFSYTFASLKRTTRYYCSAKGIESDHYTITVVDRPEVKSLDVRLVFPFYTKMPPVEQEENSGEIVALAGTRAEFSLVANKPVAAAAVVFTPEDTATADSSHPSPPMRIETFPLRAEGNALHGVMEIRRSGSYHISLVDADSVRNVEPIEYRVAALQDEFPTIQVLAPMAETDITDASKIGVITRIHDDYGFSKLLLHYRLAQSKFAQPWKNFAEFSIPVSRNVTDEDVPYIWDLSQLSLVPQDAVEYYLEIFDNDDVTGPKSAKSPMLVLRLPSLDQVFNETDESQNSAAENLKEASEEAKELSAETEQTTRDLREQSQQKNLSWQNQKKIEDILKKQEALQKKIDSAQQQLEKTVQSLESHNALSPETMQKYLELQNLLKQMNSPELQKALDRLRQAMKQLSPQQMQDAMKNFTFNDKEFRQSIERTMQLLKRIQAEQKTHELIQRAEQLKNQQAQLREQTQNAQAKDAQSLSQQQQNLQQQAEDLQRRAEQLQQEMNDLGKDAPRDSMNAAIHSLDSAHVAQNMKNAQQQIQQQSMNRAAQSQQMAEQGLEQFAQNMQGIQQQMKANEQREVENQMRRALQDLLDLTQREEGIKRRTDAAEENSSQLPQIAKDQANTESDLHGVVNRMIDVAQKSFAVTPEMGKELGQALRNMQDATGNLEQRQSPQAGENEGNAIGNMNRAATMMQQALQQMAKGSPGAGAPGESGLQSFLQQLNQMTGEQQAINAETQKYGNAGKLTMEQQAHVARIAGEQSAVQQSLQQLQQEQEQMTGGRKNTLGDLSKIAEDMQSVVNDMRNNNINPETIQRQERILSRMLDAQRSQNNRDYDNKREGKAGTDVTRQSPATLPNALTQPPAQSNALLRLIEQGYTRDYQERIKKYFEALQKTAQQPQ